MKDTIKEIKELLKTGTFVLGTEESLKAAKQGTIQKAFVSSNCPEDISEELKRYADINKFEIVLMDASNKELGTLAKKPFSISIISAIK
ncbi:MAG: ribosomal L7Ae/L30e/S12e/Gadd45 family protein [Nanoarchaeota archaeon]|nr:ribosomal L7Ae/L30e/S12e/Gadd45 family protein [Nanoarchaeota archaeon]